MNRLQIVATSLIAAVALGFTLRTLGQHEPAASAAPAAAVAATAYTDDSEHIPANTAPAELPPSF